MRYMKVAWNPPEVTTPFARQTYEFTNSLYS